MTCIFVNKRRYRAQFLFYADKSSDYADADVSRLCGSISPHPVRCPVNNNNNNNNNNSSNNNNNNNLII